MRKLYAMLGVIVAAILGWTAWWFFIATAKDRALEAWLAARRADGWVAEAAAIDVGGFPYRVDTTIRDLELANPEGGWSWKAPEFQFTALAYQPNHLIAFWPPEQTVSTPFGATQVTSQTLRGSVIFQPNPRLGLRRATIELKDVVLAGAQGWRVGLADGILALREAEAPDAPPNAYDVALDAHGVTPPAAIARSIASGVLAERIDAVSFEATAVFDRPLDREAVEGARPSIERLVIDDAVFAWGRLDLRAHGALVADADGLAEGRIDLRARNWREMVDIAERSGALSPGVASALQGGLGLIARLGGDRNSIDAALDFAGGSVRLGPIPLGPAPRLAAR
ncbi:DUF2125 domain-containing protein [Amaricoccus sp.]|uniref:DUF2125 domain-containing protein n=1 Tax=Amaricoccus sp. TaxID=1872485 RepID=UPI001B42DC5F|nr:DUF2125 domain-containing protein [Amaricoccus sp.]MBP7000199.1 DUF2125 domain-containing protein [Amaricoccus sp.]